MQMPQLTEQREGAVELGNSVQDGQIGLYYR